MKWFIDLSIRTKLLSSFLLVAFIAGAIGWLGYNTTSSLMASQDELYTDRLIPIRDLGFANAELLTARGDMRNAMAAKTTSERKTYIDKVHSNYEKTEEYISAYEKTFLVQDEKDTLALFRRHWKEYRRHLDAVLPLALAMKDKEALAILDTDARKELTLVRRYLDALIRINSRIAEELDQRADGDAQAGERLILGFLILGMAVAVALGVMNARIVAVPLNQLIGNIRNADLNSRFNAERKDEVGKLQDAFDGFVDSIKSTLVQVSEASAAVASASTQISSSTEELAAGAQEQSSQATEVAGAVEEMTKTIMENSRNAGDAAETAKRARENAEKGSEVVRRTVDGMKGISSVVNASAETVKALGRSSDQIGEIISVIDDIADQTNLLALNAAIEAARAGDQGRGFAVVADEVRKLAERTTKATKEIAGMIKQIQADTKEAVQSMAEGTQKVEAGIGLADEAGVSLQEIVGISQQVTDKVAQIAAASEQQSSASEQISKNVEGISAVTQQSASGTQQIARTAEDLNRLTENLQQMLAKFHLEGASETPETAAPHRVKPKMQRSRKAVTEKGMLVES